MKEKELKKRIEELRERIETRYIPNDIREELKEKLEFLEKLYSALYLY